MFFDTLPFPNITAKDAEERSKQTVDYLIQFKEELEFILNSIVSGDYGKILSQPTQTAQAIINTAREEGLTIAEVVNSATFKAALNGVREETLDSVPKAAKEEVTKQLPNEVASKLPNEVAEQFPTITFAVNFDTGNLDYTLT